MSPWGKFIVVGLSALVLVGCTSAPSVPPEASPAAEPAEQVTETTPTPTAKTPTVAPVAQMEPATAEEWCEVILDLVDLPGITDVEATGYVEPGGSAVNCSAGSFGILAVEANDPAAARAKRDELNASPEWQALSTGLEQKKSIGGVAGEFIYSPADTLGGAVFSGDAGDRFLTVHHISSSADVPPESVYLATLEPVVKTIVGLPFPADPLNAACLVPRGGEERSGHVFERVSFEDSGIHAPELKVNTSCAWTETVEGQEIRRGLWINTLNDEAIGGTLENSGWTYCKASDDFTAYYLSDANGQNIELKRSESENGNTLWVIAIWKDPSGTMC